jgi:hypothetical protein
MPRAALVYGEVGPAGVWSPGANHIGPSLDVLVSVRLRPDQSSSISLVGLIPLVSSSVERSYATLDVTTFAIGGFGDLHLAFGKLELHAGLGALALISSLLAKSDMYGYAQPETQHLAALLGRVGASLSLTRDVSLVASVMGGLAIMELQIKPPAIADDKTVITWGRPLLVGSLNLQLALPWDR